MIKKKHQNRKIKQEGKRNKEKKMKEKSARKKKSETNENVKNVKRRGNLIKMVVVFLNNVRL